MAAFDPEKCRLMAARDAACDISTNITNNNPTPAEQVLILQAYGTVTTCANAVLRDTTSVLYASPGQILLYDAIDTASNPNFTDATTEACKAAEKALKDYCDVLDGVVPEPQIPAKLAAATESLYNTVLWVAYARQLAGI